MYDCLTEMSGEVTILNSDCLDEKLLTTFIDACNENECLKLILE